MKAQAIQVRPGLLLAGALLLVGCSDVPLTDRNQLNLVPESELRELSAKEYRDFMQQHRVSDQEQWVAMVERVGRRISAAADEFLRQSEDAERLEGVSWEFNLVESSQTNAFAMPGGKVVVYEGLMQLLNSEEAELAAVMAHEVAHVIAGHGNERVSQQMLSQLGALGLSWFLGDESAELQQVFMTAYGLGTQLGVLLPFSRTHETEADMLGLIFMAKAGYDPREAIDVWKKMQLAAQGNEPLPFLSTHPSHKNRIQRIEEFLPEAMQHAGR